MSVFCMSQGNCSPQESAALITAVVASIGLLVNLAVGILMWRGANRNNRESHGAARALAEQKYQYDKNIEVLKRSLDQKTERRKIQLVRLRELQRGAEDTRHRALALNHLQAALAAGNGLTDDASAGFVETAGSFMRAAAAIFALPELGAPNLPETCSGPLQNLRQAVVRVTLLLNLDPSNSSRLKDPAELMTEALNALASAVSAFVKVVEMEEERQVTN